MSTAFLILHTYTLYIHTALEAEAVERILKRVSFGGCYRLYLCFLADLQDLNPHNASILNC